MGKPRYLRWGVVWLAIHCSRSATAQDSSAVWVNAAGTQQYFAVHVKDVDKAADWYRTAFGLREVDRSSDRTWRIVNLSNERLFVELISDDRAQDVDRARGFAKVGFQVPDVRVVADRVGRATGTRPRVIEFARHGVRIVQIRDPEGNIIQLSSPLKE